jgi:hypothetical protein
VVLVQTNIVPLEEKILISFSFSLQKITIYLIKKLNKKPIILTFGQFDHLIIMDKLI